MSYPSVHEALQESGQPHVHLTYDSVLGEARSLPLVVGILGDFSGRGLGDLPPLKNRRFVPVTLEQLDSVMSGLKAELNIAVPNKVTNEHDEYLAVSLRFEKIEDFSPLGLIEQIPELKQLLENRREIENIDNWQQRLGKLREIDKILTQQLRVVLHHEKFQALEGTWRGLHFLLASNPERRDIEFRLLSCSKKELLQDFERAPEIEESTLYKHIFDDELGSVGGEPFSFLVGDFEFDHSSDDVALLSAIAYVSGVAMCPFITSPSASFIGLENWESLPATRGLTQLFSSSNYVKWNSFRESDDARYVTMVLPRVLARDLYGSRPQRGEEIEFQEVDFESDGVATDLDSKSLCWMNGAYLLAAKIVSAFVETGFCSRFIGPETGGLIQNLPGVSILDEKGEVTTRFGAEIDLTGSHIAELAELGLIPIVNVNRSKACVFFNGDTTLKPKTYSRDDANQAAAAFAWMPYVMSVSRIAQYLLAIVHDRLGSTGNTRQLQELLNSWIQKQCAGDQASEGSGDRQSALRSGSVTLEDIPRNPHYLMATLRLLPWPAGCDIAQPLTISIPIPRGR